MVLLIQDKTHYESYFTSNSIFAREPEERIPAEAQNLRLRRENVDL